MIELRNLSKSFITSSGQVDALQHVSLTVNDGDIYGIIGMSGAGKSTLVRCINMLERPTEGSVLLNGRDLGALNKKEIQLMRRKVTMIFQSFNLLMQRTCLQNILFPLKLAHMPRQEAETRARKLLETVGLPDKANAYPAQLSGGQQQRVAIARALATDPEVLLCDEATSALDPKTTHSILELIRQINRDTGITVIVITHQMSVVQEICNRVAILENGTVVEEGDVSRVFSRPQAAATRALVFPEAEQDELLLGAQGNQLIRLVFDGSDTTNTPLIASMAIDCGIAASIISASTRTLSGRVYGYMLLEIPGGPDELAQAVKYLSGTPGITVQVDVEYRAKEAAQ
ncbi:MAG: ATP-binding cassette domain-containing protein [Clostridia bacterium]|jgi:D-methionine transport system ATP-binding protein|nr:ATP-binding cassette domain-containing protein [Clostridia bacterium]MBQ9343517.1 ATP-binding cassette domain-containing protein [Clostridia bacterium]MBR6299902.1 ATP-binding cassette domain-containing protein [Clostridia bacterium]